MTTGTEGGDQGGKLLRLVRRRPGEGREVWRDFLRSLSELRRAEDYRQMRGYAIVVVNADRTVSTCYSHTDEDHAALAGGIEYLKERMARDRAEW